MLTFLFSVIIIQLMPNSIACLQSFFLDCEDVFYQISNSS